MCIRDSVGSVSAVPDAGGCFSSPGRSCPLQQLPGGRRAGNGPGGGHGLRAGSVHLRAGHSTLLHLDRSLFQFSDLMHQITDLFGVARGGTDGNRWMGLGFPDQTIIWDSSAIHNTTAALLEQQSPAIP